MLVDRLIDLASSNEALPVSRRSLLRAGLAAGGGLLIGVGFGAAAEAAESSAGPSAFVPSAFIRIDPDGAVTLTMPYVEMGQGTYTSIPMLLAEELEVDLGAVRLEHAPASDKLYANPLLGIQMTGGSTTIRGSFLPMRKAGAVARTMLVQAAAQRWRVPPESCRASAGAVHHDPSGKRLHYGDLVADAARLPVPRDVPLKPLAASRLIGTPVKRLDAQGKVDGSARYGIDVRLPGMKVATLAQSPAFGGRLKSVDDRQALKIPGVRQVVRLDDCVAVVADHMGAAQKGLAALVIDWDDGPNKTLGSADIVDSMRQALQQSPATPRNDGDFDAALASATTRLDAIYELPFLAHAALEPMNCTVDVRPDACEVWTGTQVMTRAQAIAAEVTGLPIERVTVHNELLGGSFGRRLEVDGVKRAVQIARHVNGPVKVVWSREEDLQHDMYRPYFYDRMQAGLDGDGRLVAWRHRIIGASIIKRFLPPAYINGVDFETIDGAEKPPYALSNIRVEYVNHEPPNIPTAFWRGVGPTHNIFVVESFIDELAAAAKQDPVAFRLAMLDHNPRAKRVLELAAERAGWHKALPEGWGRGVSLQFAFGTYMAQVVEVELPPGADLQVRRVVVAVDCGVVVNPDTVRAQVQSSVLFGLSAALHNEITFKDGRVEQSNFHDYRVLRMNEAPPIDAFFVQSEAAPGGMGEPGTSAIAPALANAVYAATGKRLRKLPLGPAIAS
jgi:CO/xanthine dehydrogenase Mo-binding subunit